MNPAITENEICGCLLGCAVGDSCGLHCEGLTKDRQRKIYKAFSGPLLIYKFGMLSDDTEHASMTAQALMASNTDEKAFTNDLAWQLRFWLLCLPSGIGFATLRSIIKLWLGFPPDKSGVFSAGNGPSMRAPIIGLLFGHNHDMLKKIIKASTILTHKDPKAEYGAIAVSLAAYIAATVKREITPEVYVDELKSVIEDECEEFFTLLEKVKSSIYSNSSTEDFASSLGLQKGISGYTYHTVPVVIHSWLRNQNDYKKAITEIIELGGDTDTTAAILGGIIGSHVGKSGIPSEWLNRVKDWPMSLSWIEKTGKRLYIAAREERKMPHYPFPWILTFFRNIFFMIIVLIHGFRRLLPPY